MCHSQACPHHEFDDEVTITNAEEGVLRNRHKSEAPSEEFTIETERVSGECTTSKREDRNAGSKLGYSFEIIMK